MKLTLCSNAGLSIDTGESRILVDIVDDVIDNPDFFHPDALCFTHCHEDHFSKAVTEKFIRSYPDLRVFLPESHIPSQFSLNAKRHNFFIKKTELVFVKLIHEGKEYADIPHYGIILNTGKKKFFLTGDCRVAGDDIMDSLNNVHPDVVVVDFPWVTLGRGREFILNTLRPRDLFIVHFSGAEEDIGLYRKLTMKVLDKLKGINVHIMDRPFCSAETGSL